MKAWTAWFFSILLLAASTAGAEPVEPLAEGDTVSATGCIAEIGLADARSADELGLPSISVRLYASLFRDNPGLASREELVRAYSDALLNSGDAASAETFLASHSFADSPWWRLSLSLCMLERGDAAGASALLQPATDFASLDARRMPWFHLANGLVRARMGDSRGASENYARAMEGAVDEALRSQISLLMLREQLENGRADSIVVTDLRQRVKDMQGQRGGFEAGRLLAVALYQMDRPTEALSVLDEQLRYIGVDEGSTRGQILLLVAYIAGPDSGRGRSAIQQILVNASLPSELLENALEMLVSDSRTPSTTIRGVLDGVISTSPRHPLMDRLLLIRSRLSLDEGRLDDSVADAQRVIDQFPASKLRGTALRMLAYVAFNRQPPQYRTVASFLSLLRSELPEGPERAGLGLIIADCFFLDTDYASAATAYADAFEEVGENRGGILYQMVLSRIRDGQTDGARADLDRFGAAHGVDSMHRWRAEWNLVQSMRARGLAGSARERVNMLLTGGAAENLGAELRLRLMWLQAQLELDDGEAASVPASCRTILDTIGTLPDDVLAPDQRALLSSHALLLMGQAHLAMDNEADASTAFGILRAQHPESMAARNSYLVQSRWLFSHERLVEAQHQLLTLADRHPASAQAPIALWEAALAAEQRGLDVAYREAISILERLAGGYPSSDLVFYARLRQGDILRKLNDFSTALLVYEDLVTRFPNHPDLHLAQMCRADCMISQSAHDPARRADGNAIYERLMDRHDVPADFRAEAAFKWAGNLAKMGDTSRAIDAHFLTFSRYMESGDSSGMGAKGRYWVARAAVELGQLLELSGRFDEARRVYQLMLGSNLPGRALANARLKRLDEPVVSP